MCVKIDNIDYSLTKESSLYTIFQFCYKKGIHIPCFCYHEKLTIAGNCRMCIVQINVGLGVSCAINIVDNMVIFTNNKRVRDARESILEFLLINHPLDCPICDQGGECDLQDISLVFGSDRGRFYEEKKRSVDNFSQNGPLIKTMMTRCIHCTRCVRFANEISNFPLGVLDRGSNMEIGTYYNMNLLDPLSGNIIDLCPVGALTSMPYAFKQRSWESTFFTNIDFLDSLASTVRLYIYDNQITRILPLLDESLNEEWITNKTRFFYDSLIINRLSYPKLNLSNKFIVISWDYAILWFFKFFKKTILNNLKIISSIGFFSDLKTTLSLKGFFNTFGCSNIFYNLKKINWIFDFKELFSLNILIEKLELIKFYLFISCDLRLELPILNIRIKKNFNLNKNNELYIYSYGLSLNYSTYPIRNLGNSIFKFLNFLEGKQRFSCDFFLKNFNSFSYLSKNYNYYSNAALFFGNSIIFRKDAKSFLNSFFSFLKNKFISFYYNIVNSFLGFYSFSNLVLDSTLYKNQNELGFYYLLSNESNINYNYKKNSYVVYQSFIKNNLYFDADLIFASNCLYEFDSLYLNLEGKFRTMRQNITPSEGSKNDWEIISLLNIYNKKNNVIKVNYFVKYYKIIKFFYCIINNYCNFFINITHYYIALYYNIAYNNEVIDYVVHNFKINLNLTKFKFFNSLFNSYINNYYITDMVTKNSKTMSFSSLKQYRIFKLNY